MRQSVTGERAIVVDPCLLAMTFEACGVSINIEGAVVDGQTDELTLRRNIRTNTVL